MTTDTFLRQRDQEEPGGVDQPQGGCEPLAATSAAGAGPSQWTSACTRDRMAQLRLEAQQFFGVTRGALLFALGASSGQDSVWNWLNWALCEWEYGWPESVREMCERLQVRSVLDFGSGVGEIGLHLAAQLDVPVTYCDLPGDAREFLCWRLGGRLDLNTHRPRDPEAVLESSETWDAVLCLEVLEHIANAPAVLRQLLDRARIAICSSGVTGRPKDDGNPVHVYTDSLLPVLEQAGWVIVANGGGMPWWFMRAEEATARGLPTFTADGQPEECAL